MKTKLRRLRRYVNCGAIPKNEYRYGSGKPTIESLLSPTEGTERVKKIIARHASLKLPVKARPAQQLRQDRVGKRKPAENAPGREPTVHCSGIRAQINTNIAN